MKIEEAVFFTDNETVRLVTDCGPFYLTNKKKLYDMHPINVMAKELDAKFTETIKKAAKADKYKNDEEVKKWL